MKYFKYYRLTTLMTLNRKHLGFSAVFVAIYIFLTSTFFGENGAWVMGPSTFFIISLFTMSMYAHQARFESTNPMYQFPLTAKERTKYEYISIFVVFIGLLIFMVLFGFLMLGIFALFGDVGFTDGEEVTSSFWTDSYNIAHHLFIVAFVMPLSYVESKRKKYIYGILSAVSILLIHMLFYGLATGGLNIDSPITSVITAIPYYQFIIIAVLVLSILSVIISYKKSVKLNAYN
jgi:hypothetical protein